MPIDHAADQSPSLTVSIHSSPSLFPLRQQQQQSPPRNSHNAAPRQLIPRASSPFGASPPPPSSVWFGFVKGRCKIDARTRGREKGNEP